jgi:hypothetical protein
MGNDLHGLHKSYTADLIVHSPGVVLCRGLYHPSVQDKDGKWLPDLKSRYLWEDVPHGLVAMKGAAQLMGVATPSIDT